MNALSLLRRPFHYTYRNATLAIIAVNIAVYLLFTFTPLFYYTRYLELSVIGFVRMHMFWQPFTYMFIHSGTQHLFFNMLALLFFGIGVERTLGTKEFVLMYLLTGTLCGIISLAVYWLGGIAVFLAGASGSIYGILLAYAVIFPRSRIFIWGIIPVPAPVMVLGYTVIELGSQLTGAGGGVAHLTHLAGFAVVWLYFKIRMGISPTQVWKDAYR
ncbi:MAG: rhomboid family intramembrane serine protease [Treponema sp.]|nr:rhomboid family intramembrane serine protease [Treponema sp.]